MPFESLYLKSTFQFVRGKYHVLCWQRYMKFIEDYFFTQGCRVSKYYQEYFLTLILF